ncbi:hypothetical protein ACTA71_009408 [Dictyostelium dimigraforme]
MSTNQIINIGSLILQLRQSPFTFSLTERRLPISLFQSLLSCGERVFQIAEVQVMVNNHVETYVDFLELQIHQYRTQIPPLDINHLLKNNEIGNDISNNLIGHLADGSNIINNYYIQDYSLNTEEFFRNVNYQKEEGLDPNIQMKLTER